MNAFKKRELVQTMERAAENKYVNKESKVGPPH